MKKNNKESNTYIKAMKIKIIPICDIKEENLRDKYYKELYQYLRDSIWAQNAALNYGLAMTRDAYVLHKNEDKIKDIYFKLAHQTPNPSMASEARLKEVYEAAPITQEYIDNKVEEFKKSNSKKKKPLTDEGVKKKTDSINNMYKKFIGLSKEDIQELIYKLDDYCAYPEEIYEKFANGFSTPAYVTQQIKDYWNTEGVMTKVIYSMSDKLRSVKNSNPLTIPPNLFYNKKNDLIGITHSYNTYLEFVEALMNAYDANLFLELPYKKGYDKMKFKLILGNPCKSHEVRISLQKIFEEYYKIRGSKIGFVRNKKTGKNTDLVLYLSVEIPKDTSIELDENTVVGVDLGLAVPAVCALNNNPYPRKYIGKKLELLKKRTQFKNRRKKLQSELRDARGGHGRRRKMKAMDRLSELEKNFADTYCHKVAKKVVMFALKNKAKYINLEMLKGYRADEKVLQNWSYYRIQMYIKILAERYGIIVRFINPCYTSQVCSVCGNWHPGNRPKGDKGQKYFDCHNDKCESHTKNKGKGYTLNADYNAARNIAMCDLFMDNKSEITEEDKKIAREKYGIPEPVKKEEKIAA